jgi:hypothetical protein
MKRREQARTQDAPFFTVEDHLRVHHQIERRAYELWRAGGCRAESALSDWLRAEREVLEQFVLAYNARHLARREASQRLPPQVKPPPPNSPNLGLRPNHKSKKSLRTTVTV